MSTVVINSYRNIRQLLWDNAEIQPRCIGDVRSETTENNASCTAPRAVTPPISVAAPIAVPVMFSMPPANSDEDHDEEGVVEVAYGEGAFVGVSPLLAS